ncbi:unnamed protein product [Prorocentrum cordatum]|uniref:Uncharacterized protein n=1 Tax=Prorocentrum cordatum TaxID=2364126 RepID=A0ABN9YI47_9DINO|nr:unnamed protein product [Polarella glacialis]
MATGIVAPLAAERYQDGGTVANTNSMNALEASREALSAIKAAKDWLEEMAPERALLGPRALQRLREDAVAAVGPEEIDKAVAAASPEETRLGPVVFASLFGSTDAHQAAYPENQGAHANRVTAEFARLIKATEEPTSAASFRGIDSSVGAVLLEIWGEIEARASAGSAAAAAVAVAVAGV